MNIFKKKKKMNQTKERNSPLLCKNKPCAATARPAAAFPCASAATEKFGDVGGDAAVEVEQGTSTSV